MSHALGTIYTILVWPKGRDSRNVPHALGTIYIALVCSGDNGRRDVSRALGTIYTALTGSVGNKFACVRQSLILKHYISIAFAQKVKLVIKTQID